MKLLVLTQKVNKDDSEFTFFHSWLAEFAHNVEELIVICLEEGPHNLPSNTKVLSLGKEKGGSKSLYIQKFYSYIWKERKNYNAVFVHMNPEYVILGAPIWKLFGKKISLWYVHRQVNMKLRLAEKCADIIFTSAPESFGIQSRKVHVVGHGVDVEKFLRMPLDTMLPLTLLHIGRITRIKRLEVILQAVKKLIDKGVPVRALHFAGATVTDADRVYKSELQGMVENLHLTELVSWDGVIDNAETLSKATLSINAAPDGGMDKSVLESLAAGRPVFVSNKAFVEVFGGYKDQFMYKDKDSDELAQKIRAFLERGDKKEIVERLREKIGSEYSVQRLVKKIVGILSDK